MTPRTDPKLAAASEGRPLTDQRHRPTVAVDVLVEAGDWPAAELQRLSTMAVHAAVGVVPAEIAEPAEVSLLFTDDKRMRALNRRWRGVDSATDVLSLPGAPVSPGRYGPLLGDIVLARETIVDDAAAAGLTIDHHLTHLIVHGFLHLVGYDHADDRDARVMEGLETAILADLGIADPYAAGGDWPWPRPDHERQRPITRQR